MVCLRLGFCSLGVLLILDIAQYFMFFLLKWDFVVPSWVLPYEAPTKVDFFLVAMVWVWIIFLPSSSFIVPIDVEAMPMEVVIFLVGEASCFSMWSTYVSSCLVVGLNQVWIFLLLVYFTSITIELGSFSIDVERSFARGEMNLLWRVFVGLSMMILGAMSKPNLKVWGDF